MPACPFDAPARDFLGRFSKFFCSARQHLPDLAHPPRHRGLRDAEHFRCFVIDPKFGRIMNHSFAEYHVPVNADIHDIEVIFVHEDDDVVNTLGAKGIGEIGVVGIAAAIANAVYHATGRRVRDLPITLDKLL